ncbi:MAG: LysE family translocator [Gammaproteobacteria bacterium]|nr:LysE family translocator [Gammaproteobacteria bacterium]MBU2057789.1 LysE family translocator [Gammaproteobacteria bacterium]MBU2176776.1 LysE family translocator [Gammaproteobacteria bacterium]MBU2247909.1 LysE family translocator [Gammaproteobacteria bacterium]MBU2345286.1 LysE family translocator [Gammaproteobacteria bacterium]
MEFWPEFLLIASVHLVAVASPGPDFAIVLRYAVRYGRTIALSASMGIGAAILLHVCYSLLGLGLLIKTTPWLFTLFSVLSAAYLAYIGWQAVRSGAATAPTEERVEAISAAPSLLKAFTSGFVTNGLNPKATLFFLSLFAVIISPVTPLSYKVIYGLYMAFATAAWFAFLSVILTREKVRAFLLLKGYWFDRLMGAVLLALAMHLIYSAIQSQLH